MDKMDATLAITSAENSGERMPLSPTHRSDEPVRHPLAWIDEDLDSADRASIALELTAAARATHPFLPILEEWRRAAAYARLASALDEDDDHDAFLRIAAQASREDERGT